MRNRFGMEVLVGLVSLCTLGCMQSPLLNHAVAGTTGPQPVLSPTDDRSQEDRERCPLVFKNAGLCAAIAWVTSPTADAEGSFTLRFWRADTGTSGGPYTDPSSTVFVKLWMPEMGHGSSPVHVAHARDAAGAAVAGVFDANNVYFVMPGQWEIHVQLRNGNSVVEEAVEKVSI